MTRSYIDKLTRMTPDERQKLKTSIAKFIGREGPLSAAELKGLSDSHTNSKEDDYYDRLQLLRAHLGAIPEARQALYHLEREFHVNAVRAAWRMDRAIRDVMSGRPLTVASVRAAPDGGTDAPTAITVQSAVPVDRADARKSFEDGERLFQEGCVALDQGERAFATKFSESARLCARAVRGDYNKPRAFFYLGSALLYRDAAPEDMERACELLAKSLELAIDKETLLNLGKAHALVGHTDRAVEFLERAVALEPKWAHVHFLLSGLYDKQPDNSANARKAMDRGKGDGLTRRPIKNLLAGSSAHLLEGASNGRRAAEHVKAAVREKSEYKKKYQSAIKFSELASRSAKLVVEIIQKTENNEMTASETDHYAERIAADPSLVVAAMTIAGLGEALAEALNSFVDDAVAVGKVFLGPVGYVAAGFWSLYRSVPQARTITGPAED